MDSCSATPCGLYKPELYINVRQVQNGFIFEGPTGTHIAKTPKEVSKIFIGALKVHAIRQAQYLKSQKKK